MAGFMNKNYYIPVFLIGLFVACFLLGIEKNTPINQETAGEFIWPTYKHDFARTGNLQLRDYEFKPGPSMRTVGSNAPEGAKRKIFGGTKHPSPVFADIDSDGDDEVIIYYKNMVYNKTTHTRPFADFVMMIDYNENPTMLEKLEFGEVPFVRKWIFIIDREMHGSFALGDIDNDGKIEVVFGTDGGTFYALDGKDGKLKWEFKAEDKIRTSPVIGDIDSDGTQEIIFGSDDGTVYALDGTNGKLKWKFKTNDNVRSTPTLFPDDGARIAFGSDDKNLYIVDSHGRKICSFKAEGPIRASPLIYNENIVFSDLNGNIYFLSKNCGVQKKYRVDGKILGSGSVFEDKIMFASDDGFLHFFDETGEKSKIKLYTSALSTPVNLNDKHILISTTDGKIHLINDTGIHTNWENNRTTDFSCSPSVGVIKGALVYSCFYVQKEDNQEYGGVFAMSLIEEYLGDENL